MVTGALRALEVPKILPQFFALNRCVVFRFASGCLAPISWRQAGQALRYAMKLRIRPEARFKRSLRKSALVTSIIQLAELLEALPIAKIGKRHAHLLLKQATQPRCTRASMPRQLIQVPVCAVVSQSVRGFSDTGMHVFAFDTFSCLIKGLPT